MDLSSVPATGRVWHKTFFKGGSRHWAEAHHVPSISKNALDPVSIPLKGAAKAPGDKPNPSEEGLKPGGTAPQGQRYIQRQDTPNLNCPSHHGWPKCVPSTG